MVSEAYREFSSLLSPLIELLTGSFSLLASEGRHEHWRNGAEPAAVGKFHDFGPYSLHIFQMENLRASLAAAMTETGILRVELIAIQTNRGPHSRMVRQDVPLAAVDYSEATVGEQALSRCLSFCHVIPSKLF